MSPISTEPSDGRKVASAIKATDETATVILLTGSGQRSAADADAPAHVDRVLSKPPKLGELRSALAQVTLQASPAAEDRSARATP